MKQFDVFQEPFFSVSCNTEMVRLMQDAIACYDRVLDGKRGQLAPEKWSLAYPTGCATSVIGS